MRAELPEIARPAYRCERKPVSLDVIRRVCRIVLKITDQLVDLGGLETGDGDVEAFRNEELGEFWEFDSQALAVPAGIRRQSCCRQSAVPAFAPRLGHGA